MVVGDCWVVEEVVIRQTIWILRGLEKFSLVPLLRIVDSGAMPHLPCGRFQNILHKLPKKMEFI